MLQSMLQEYDIKLSSNLEQSRASRASRARARVLLGSKPRAEGSLVLDPRAEASARLARSTFEQAKLLLGSKPTLPLLNHDRRVATDA